MPRKIKPTEIAVGVVVNLDPKKLQADKSVVRTIEAVDPQARLFVCYSKRDGVSSWASLTSRSTTKSGYERLPIEPAWQRGGLPTWRMALSYLYDGANTLHGPDASFVAASSEATKHEDCGWIDDVGVAEIRDEITRQLGRRERDAGMAGGETTDTKRGLVFHGDPK